MKKIIGAFFLFLLIGSLFACGTSEETQSVETDEFEKLDTHIVSYFRSAGKDEIELDVTEAFRTFQQAQSPNEEIDFVDLSLSLRVKRHENLRFVTVQGNTLSIEDVYNGDKIYLEYDIATYDHLQKEAIQMDKLGQSRKNLGFFDKSVEVGKKEGNKRKSKNTIIAMFFRVYMYLGEKIIKNE